MSSLDPQAKNHPMTPQPADAQTYVVQPESALELPAYIDRPDYVRNKTAGYGLHIVGWMVWVGLFLPLCTVLLWWFEGTTVLDQLVFHVRPRSSILSVTHLAAMILILGIIFMLWVNYNWFRFHGVDRRKSPPPVSNAELSKSFIVPEEILASMQQQKSQILHFDEDGNFLSADFSTRTQDPSML